MKAFWAFIAILILAAGGLLFARGGGAASSEALPVANPGPARSTPEPDRSGARAPESGEPPMVVPAPTDSADAAGTGEVEAEPAGSINGDAGIDVASDPASEFESEPGAAADGATGTGERAAADPVSPDGFSPDGVAPDAAAPEATEEVSAADAGTDATGTTGGPGGAADTADVAGDAAEPPAAGAEPVVAQEDGTLLLDGRHVVSGAGTAADPYVVGWDALLAVEQDYAPRQGLDEIPEWAQVLDGKHVAITGFIAFPFIAPTADECMVMLNQWDGCCIGVPPTPYDAVEVKLAETLNLQQGMVNYGTLTGVFRTDPYLVNGWLIGLYVMEDAAITEAASNNKTGF